MLNNSSIENKIHFQPDHTYTNQANDLLFETNQTILKLKQKQKAKNNESTLNDKDFEILKNSMLFKNWSDLTFKNFVNDERIKLKRFKYFFFRLIKYILIFLFFLNPFKSIRKDTKR